MAGAHPAPGSHGGLFVRLPWIQKIHDTPSSDMVPSEADACIFECSHQYTGAGAE